MAAPSPARQAPPLSDSTVEAEEVQARLFREMGPRGRMRACLELSETVVEATRGALRRLRPGATERDIDLAFIEVCYGEELARALEEPGTNRGRET